MTIEVGQHVHQTINCPACGLDCRMVAGAGTVRVTVYCANPQCSEKEQYFTVDRFLGRIVDVGHR